MHCFRLVLLGALVSLILASAPAHAQPAFMPDAPPAPAPATRVRTERYGFTLAAVDAAGFVAMLATEEPVYFMGSYTLAGPIMHLLHGNYGTAAGSLALRTGLPMAGFMVGYALSDCGYADGPFCASDYRLHGVVLGASTALLLDWLMLAKTTTREPVEAPAFLRAGSLRANPGLQVSRTGTMLLGLEGQF